MDDFWSRYNGTTRRTIVKRPTAVIVAEAEAAAYEAMTQRPSLLDIRRAVEARLVELEAQVEKARKAPKVAPAPVPWPDVTNPAVKTQAFPPCVVGMPVRCLAPGFHFGHEGVVDFYNESMLVVRYEDRFGFGNHVESAWCRIIFPCDASLLPPRIGIRVSFRDTREPHNIASGVLLHQDGQGYWRFDDPRGVSWGFDPAVHWLVNAWPTGLRGEQ